MTSQEQEQFRKEYKNILAKRDDIKKHSEHLRNLHRWDKGGSHKNAIVKALDKRDKLNLELTTMLKGSTYEQWQAISRRLSILIARIKRIKNTDRLKKYEQELNHLNL